MKLRIDRTIFLGVVVSLFLCISSWAQTAGTGALTGTVTDPSGAAIAGATVTLTSAATAQARTTMTGADGAYKFNLLPPGGYRVKFEAAGFAAVEVSIQISVTETPVLDRSLAVGSQTQAVTVEGEVETIQTASSAIGTVVGSAAVASLPLSTRNYTNLIAMSAGANADVNSAKEVGKGVSVIQVNGANNTENNYQMDGAPIDNWASFNTGVDVGLFASIPIPNPDAIQEFKIQTSGYDASYGRNAGANVNVVTKSGTNSFHGSGFEYFRNTALNANEYFLKATQVGGGQPNKQPALNQNQYGGTFGGPIKKDKLFFFTSYQETDQKNGLSLYGASSVLLPPIPGGGRGTCPTGWSTLAQCDATAQAWVAALGAANCPPAVGATSANGGVLRSSPTAVQVACNGSNVNPVAVNLLQLKLPNGQYYVPSEVSLGLPTPAAGGNQTAVFSQPAIYKEHQFLFNWDYIINNKHTLSGRDIYSSNPLTAPFGCGIVGTSVGCLTGMSHTIKYPDNAAVLKLTSIVSNNMVNEARVSYQRFLTQSTASDPFTNAQVGMAPLNPGFNPPSPLSFIVIQPQMVLGTSNGIGANMPVNQYEAGDSLSWTHGKHSLRTGFEVAHYAWSIDPYNLNLGQPTFPTFADFLIGLDGTKNGTGASNITVLSGTITANNGTLTQTFLANEYSAYLQDDWKLFPRLTLNLGVRWEFDGLPKEKIGGWANIWPSLLNSQPAPGSLASGGTLVGWMVPSNFQASIPAGVTKSATSTYLSQNTPPKDHFAPRVGFAWQPLGSGKFVIRGGGGIFYEQVNGQVTTNLGFGPPPYELSPGVTPAGTLANPWSLPPTVAGPAGTPGWPIRYLDPCAATASGPATGACPSSNLGPKTVAQTFPLPSVYEWNLTTQYEFLPSWVLELGYVGSRGVHLPGNFPVPGVNSAGGGSPPINLAQLVSPSNPICGYDKVPTDCITTNTTANLQGRTPYLGMASNWAPAASVGLFKYNSFQATVRKQLSHGLQVQAAYTWSRAFQNYWVGNVADTLSAPAGTAPARSIWGPNSNYRPQRLVVNYNWNLPLGMHKGVVGQLVNNWAWSGVTVIQDGVPLVLTDSRDGSIFTNAGGGVSLATYCPGMTNANVATSGSLTSRLNSYFNKAAFCAPQAVGNGTGYGDNGLNSGVLGPGQINWDLSLTKSFAIHEAQTLQFRTEFFNAFNHPEFYAPGTNVAQGNFGKISVTSVNPRLVQFALRYIF
jgi:hypothetical protein